MPQYATIGDDGFVGLNSRDNPAALPERYLSSAKNIRLDRGVASMRKGVKRLTTGSLVGQDIRASTVFTDTSGVDWVLLACNSALFKYNTATGILTGPINYPSGQTISATDACDMVQALGKVYILRGFAKRPLVWDGTTGVGSVTVLPSVGGSGHEFPNGSSVIYVGNRFVVNQSANWDVNSGTATGDVNDEISVSHYLDANNFSLLDTFKINDGSNDFLVGTAPWVLNEFVAFMRNSIYYCSVGPGAKATGDAVDIDEAYVKVLAKDVGCIARKSIVQAAGGIIFLSDNGVYIMNPTQATTPEGMRVGVLGDPLSSAIDDVIQTINTNHVSKAVAAYFDNRYYLAVPTGNSTSNNTVLVFNFINKAWESVDTYPDGFDVLAMHIVKYGNRRRLTFVDTQQGIFIADENDYWDEYDAGSTGNNVFNNMWFDLIFLAPGTFNRYNIDSEIITRYYGDGTPSLKRFSSCEYDVDIPAGGQLETYSLTENPDSTTLIDKFGSPANEEQSRARPVRKNASNVRIKIRFFNRRSQVRNIYMSILDPGRNLTSRD
jgi:hypothetical protein